MKQSRTRFPNTNEFIELKKRLVREALEGGNASLVARKNGLSPNTVSQWVRDYREEVEEEMAKNEKDRAQPLNQEDPDVKKQLDQALKLFGMLLVENEILKDLQKKTKQS